jgi:multidrug efflux pump subunit AcrA (membrane-fusion protein)
MSLHRLIALAALALAIAAGCRGQKPPPQMPPPKVTVVQPVTSPVRDFWEYNGFLESTEVVEVRARVKGFLTDRHFKEGAEVRGKVALPPGVTSGAELYPGDLLYEIDKREYRTAKSKATAELAKAEADILEAEAELPRTEADVENWEAQIALAKVKLARADEALAKKVGSQLDVDEANANLKVATAQHKAAKARSKAAEAQLAAANSTKDSAKSALHTTEIQLGYTDVRAPISGTIGRRAMDVGNLVGQSDPTLLTTIIRMDPLYAMFDVPERDLLEYLGEAEKRGLPHPPNETIPMEVRVPGQGHGMANEWRPGAIDYVEGSVNAGTGTVRVRGVISNPRRATSARSDPPRDESPLYLYVPGLYVQVRVPKTQPRPLPVIPEDAIMTGQEGRFVYVVGANNVAEKRIVTVGPVVWKSPPPSPGQVVPGWTLVNPTPGPPPEKGPPPPARRQVHSLVAIAAGLTTGDRVIVDGVQKARPGAPVSPEAWVMQAPAAEPTAARPK